MIQHLTPSTRALSRRPETAEPPLWVCLLGMVAFVLLACLEVVL